MGEGEGGGEGGSCLRRNDGKGRGDEGERLARVIGACRAGGGGSLRPTPYLTSPLEGGRDELGKRCAERARRVGSCLRRNDGMAGRESGHGRGGPIDLLLRVS